MGESLKSPPKHVDSFREDATLKIKDIKMALKASRGGREYDKFVADGSGDTAMRVSTTSSSTTSTVVETGAGGSSSGTGTATEVTETIILVATDVLGKSRIGIQIFNTGASATTQNAIYKVYASLRLSPGAVGGTNWTQIGDDIQVAQATNAYKAIATTPIRWIAITGEAVGADFLGDGVDLATTTNIYLMAD
jgi:hypothetical protein